MMKQVERPCGAFCRMCAACAKRARQSEMIRLSRDGDTVTVDETGKTGGRGAYVCRDKTCVERLRKTGRLAALLRVKNVPDTVYDRLEKIIDG